MHFIFHFSRVPRISKAAKNVSFELFKSSNSYNSEHREKLLLKSDQNLFLMDFIWGEYQFYLDSVIK